MPWSLTRTTPKPSTRSTSTMMSRRSGEYFIAFEIRFSSAWTAASGSIRTVTSLSRREVTVNWLWRNWLSSASSTPRVMSVRLTGFLL